MRTTRARRRRTAAVGGVAVAVVLSLTSQPWSAAAAPLSTGPSASGAPSTHRNGPTTSTLTLVTGDKVALTTGPDGKQSVNILSGGGTSKTFQTASGQNGDLYVYPEDAMAALASSTVDGELFNISRMIRDGYGDAKTDEVPALVDFQGSRPPPRSRRRPRTCRAATAGASCPGSDCPPCASTSTARRASGRPSSPPAR